MFEGCLESPHQSSRNMSEWCNSKYRLRVMVCVMVVNYRHITREIVYGCVSHRNVLSIGEHTHLETAFSECDMWEANKGLHSLGYNFGYLDPSHHLHFQERNQRMSRAMNKTSKQEKRVKSSYTQPEYVEFWGSLWRRTGRSRRPGECGIGFPGQARILGVRQLPWCGFLCYEVTIWMQRCTALFNFLLYIALFPEF